MSHRLKSAPFRSLIFVVACVLVAIVFRSVRAQSNSPALVFAPVDIAASGSNGLSTPNQIVTIDLDGNGCPDLVVPNDNATITVLLNGKSNNACTGSFTAKTPFPVAAAAKAVALADFDNDGKLDLAVLEGSSVTQSLNQVEVFKGNGDGTFQTPNEASKAICNNTTCAPKSIAALDLNADGVPDIAIGYGAPADSSGSTVGLLQGGRQLNGCGSTSINFCLAAPEVFKRTNPAGDPVGQIVLAQMSGASLPEVIVPDRTGNVVALFPNASATPGVTRNGQTLEFQSPVLVSTGNEPRGLLAFDVNKDSKLDLIFGNFADDNIGALLGTAQANTFTLPACSGCSTGAGPLALAEADFDKNGNPDIAVANNLDNTISVLSGAGDGTFAAFTNAPFALPTGDTKPVSLVAADFNGDGFPDIAVANQSSSSVTLLLNSQMALQPDSANPPNGSSQPQVIDRLASNQTVLVGDLVNSNAGAVKLDSISVNFIASGGNLSQNVQSVSLTASDNGTPTSVNSSFASCGGSGQNCTAQFPFASPFSIAAGSTATITVKMTFNGSSPPPSGSTYTVSVDPTGLAVNANSTKVLITGSAVANHLIAASVAAMSGAANFNTNEASGASNVPAVQFVLSASTSVTFTSLTFNVSGNSNAKPAADIASVGLVNDSNANGFVDATDTSLASNTTLTSNGVNSATATITLSSPLTVAAGTPVTLLLFYNFNSSLMAGNTYQATLTAGSDSNGVSIENLPVGSNDVKTIATSGSALIELGSHNVGQRPLPGDSNIPMLQLQVFASSAADLTVSSLVVTNSGSGSTASGVKTKTGVKVYLDTDHDGLFSNSEPLLGEGAFNGSTAAITFDNTTATVLRGQSVSLLVLYDYTSSAVPGTTFQAALAKSADLTVRDASNQAVTPQLETTPLNGQVATIATPPTATATATITATPTLSATATLSTTPTMSMTATHTATSGAGSSASASATPTLSATPTATPTPGAEASPQSTPDPTVIHNPGDSNVGLGSFTITNTQSAAILVQTVTIQVSAPGLFSSLQLADSSHTASASPVSSSTVMTFSPAIQIGAGASDVLTLTGNIASTVSSTGKIAVMYAGITPVTPGGSNNGILMIALGSTMMALTMRRRRWTTAWRRALMLSVLVVLAGAGTGCGGGSDHHATPSSAQSVSQVGATQLDQATPVTVGGLPIQLGTVKAK